jgi:hypothetical protein
MFVDVIRHSFGLYNYIKQRQQEEEQVSKENFKKSKSLNKEETSKDGSLD